VGDRLEMPALAFDMHPVIIGDATAEV